MVTVKITNDEINAVLLQKKSLLLVDTSTESSTPSLEAVLTISKNIEDLGFVFSQTLFNCLKFQSMDYLVDLYDDLVSVLAEMVGAHVVHKPFYPFFPGQMASLSDLDLYMNALVHYWTFGQWKPDYVRISSLPLRDEVPQTRVIELGTLGDFHQLFSDMMGSAGSLPPHDQALLGWYLARATPEDLELNIPDVIPSRETLSLVIARIMAFHPDQVDLVRPHIKTATDVLRLATALSNGDLSLVKNTQFKNFSRPERRFLLALLEQCQQLEEDMGRYPGKWKRLGEKLHPGDYAKSFPLVYQVFSKIRRGDKLYRFAGEVTLAMKMGDSAKALALLETRPGEFARKLDHLARTFPESGQVILNAFSRVSNRVSSQVLLQAMAHFRQRHLEMPTRSFFPKGNIAKVQVVDNAFLPLEETFCQAVVEICEKAMIQRLGEKPSLGKVYIDPVLQGIIVPLAQRASSRGLKTFARGSRFAFGEDMNVIRAFVHWQNILVAVPSTGNVSALEEDRYADGIWADDENVDEPLIRVVSDWRDLVNPQEQQVQTPTTGETQWNWREIRTDIDLSLGLYDADWGYVDHISYTHLRSDKFAGLYHSGDIVDAPEGGSEFVDMDIQALLDGGVRYAVFNVYSFTHQGFNEIPDCFFGWMERDAPESGEIFDPKSVVNKIDLASETTICLPVLFDLVAREALWMDLSLRSNLYWVNSIEANRNNVVLMSQAMIHLHKPNLFDLFRLNATARGELVGDPTAADMTFGMQETDDVTPFQVERILTEFM